MSKLHITLDQLDNIAMSVDIDIEAEVWVDYSGRGMYGQTCLGYTGGSLVTFVAALALQIATSDASAWDLIETIGEIGDGQQDSMGTGRIVYWPHIVVDDAEEAEDDI